MLLRYHRLAADRKYCCSFRTLPQTNCCSHVTFPSTGSGWNGTTRRWLRHPQSRIVIWTWPWLRSPWWVKPRLSSLDTPIFLLSHLLLLSNNFLNSRHSFIISYYGRIFYHFFDNHILLFQYHINFSSCTVDSGLWYTGTVYAEIVCHYKIVYLLF